jgi:hypothetical protein
MLNHPEMGRELKPSELLPFVGFVVIVEREGANVGLTAWVQYVDDECVAFKMGVPGITLWLKRNEDDTLADDLGTHIKAYEFLGEV